MTSVKTRALVAMEPRVPPQVVEVVLPELGPEGVRIRMLHAGICHSDLSMVDGSIVPEFPVILGHEAAAEVLEVGEEVGDLEPGARVVLNWAPPCRSCWFCLNAEPWLCKESGRFVSRPYGTLLDGTPVEVSLGVGAFAEEAVLPRTAVVPLPDGVGADVAALMGCAVLTGVGAVRNEARVRSGEAVAVFGLGGIGLSAVMGARLAGAHPIIGVDLNEAKAEAALQVGATDFLAFDDGVVKSIRRLTGRRGVDHAFECVGRPQTIETAWASTRRGGDCVVLGVGSMSEVAGLKAMEIHHYARTLRGCVAGSSDPERDIPVLAEFARSGLLDLEALISHRIALEETNAAFERMRSGVGLRSVIDFGRPSA